jgi:hypothetical protein
MAAVDNLPRIDGSSAGNNPLFCSLKQSHRWKPVSCKKAGALSEKLLRYQPTQLRDFMTSRWLRTTPLNLLFHLTQDADWAFGPRCFYVDLH